MLDEIGYYGPNISDGVNIFFFAIFYKSLWFYVIFGILISRLINAILKKIFRVERQKQIPFHGHIAKCYAMPSGHSQAVTYSATLMYFFNKYLFILLALIALSTMRQRYVYRNHTIPQIIIGGGIGILLGVLSVNFMKEMLN